MGVWVPRRVCAAGRHAGGQAVERPLARLCRDGVCVSCVLQLCSELPGAALSPCTARPRLSGPQLRARRCCGAGGREPDPSRCGEAGRLVRPPPRLYPQPEGGLLACCQRVEVPNDPSQLIDGVPEAAGSGTVMLAVAMTASKSGLALSPMLPAPLRFVRTAGKLRGCS